MATFKLIIELVDLRADFLSCNNTGAGVVGVKGPGEDLTDEMVEGHESKDEGVEGERVGTFNLALIEMGVTLDLSLSNYVEREKF